MAKTQEELRHQLITLNREIERRKNRRLQSSPTGGLLEFIKFFWPVLEPQTPFVEGWALHAICDHLEAVTRGEVTRLLINVPPGFMKPVHVDEPVLTDCGYTPLKDIQVGDLVVTHKGRLRPVTAVHQQGVLPLLKLKTWAGREVKAAEDHPFLTPDGWVQLKDLKEGNYVGVPRLNDYPDHQTMSPEEARLLGYLVGDGCISQRSLAFVNMDADAIEDFIFCASACGFYAYVAPHPNKKVKASKVILKSTKDRWKDRSKEPPILEWLRRHDLYLSNSYTKRIPKAVMRSGPTAIANFVGAYWSCDGNVTVRHANKKTTMLATACSVSLDLANDLLKALGILNIEARVRRHVSNIRTKSQSGDQYISYIVQTSTRNEVAKIAKLPGLMKRKRDIAAAAFADRFEPSIYADEVVSVLPDGEGECRCLTVEEDSSFVVNGIAVHNSLLTNVFWPAWEWGPMDRPELRYVSFSYSSGLTERDNAKFRDLITSPEYRALWGDRFATKKVGEIKVTNNKTGSKLATSVGGIGTGERGDRALADDLHNIKDGESEVIRSETVRWFKEALSNRLNDMEKSAIVVIMQRVHEGDVSGAILENEMNDYVHLMIPMEYDPSRHCVTPIWEDPRSEEGELAWPERFPPEVVLNLKSTLGPYAYAGQYQQAPAPRGGGIFKREWWQLWDDPQDRYPPLEYVLVSADTAYTAKESNDPSACTVWGLFRENGAPRLILLYAWRKHLEMHGRYEPRYPGETTGEYVNRTRPHWGLVEWLAHTAQRYKADTLLIEGKATGVTAMQELKRLYAQESWAVQLSNPKGDKVARAHAAQPVFSQLLVYAPDKEWADMVITEMSTFPKGRYKDLTDSATQAIKFFRDSGMLIHRNELLTDEDRPNPMRSKPQPLYPV